MWLSKGDDQTSLFNTPVARVILTSFSRYISLDIWVSIWSTGEADAKQQVANKPIKDHTIALDEVLHHLEATSSTDIRNSMQAVGHRSVDYS